jgi:hypothetical protein
MVSAFALVVLPWSLHAYRETGSFRLSAGTGVFTFYVGNATVELDERGRAVHPWNRFKTLGDTPTERNSEARRLALRAVADRMPWWPVEKLGEVGESLAPTSLASRRLQQAPEGERAPMEKDWSVQFRSAALESSAFREAAAAATVAFYLLVLLAGVGGLSLGRDRQAARLFALYVVAHLLPVALAFGLTRFRQPFMPVLAVYAAVLLCEPRALWREASALRRAATLAAVVVALAAVFYGWRAAGA